MEDKIVHTALENLKKHTGILGTYKATHKEGLDGKVEFVFQNGRELFMVEVKKEIRNHQLPAIEDMARNNKNFLLIAENIFPTVKDALRHQGIGYLDIAGNIFLQTPNRHLWIEGHKVEKQKTEKTHRAFKTAGLKVIYLFLTDESLLNKPQRTIAEEAGIALGNINYILSELKAMKFLIQKNKKELQLMNKHELLLQWIPKYEEILKPTLHIGNFRFLKNDDYNHWSNTVLQKNQTYWGGEPAGAVITNYLLPEIFTLYTDETRNDLIKNYRLVPDPNGNIKAYKKFWKSQNTFDETTVHPLLVYTDLMNTGDRRSMETAQKIYDELLSNRF